MTIKELEYVLKILDHIKDSDNHVEKAKAFVKKDLANHAAHKGQLREQYEVDWHDM